MVDKNAFMDTIHAVAEVAKTSAEPLTKEEVLSYFKDMELSSDQENMVYEYFLTPVEEEEEVSSEQEEENDGEEDAKEEEESQLKTAEEEMEQAQKAFLESTYVKMYLDDIKGVTLLSEEDLIPYYKMLLQGEEESKIVITENYLSRVIEIAKRYVLLPVHMEDVIQEGNMGLLIGVNSLFGHQEKVDVEAALNDFIKEAMERFIDESVEDENWENIVLGRVNLLHEAEESLTKELGRVPTPQEMSEYTKLTVEEIAGILSLVKEKKKTN